MKKKALYLLLLLSLFFNIAHALVFTKSTQECHHQGIQSYTMEQSQNDSCNDMCDLHPLFHFVAIIVNYDLSIQINTAPKVVPFSLLTLYEIEIENSFKPPIV